MKSAIAAAIAIAAFVAAAAGRNVIVLWGNHDPNDVHVDVDQYTGNDVGVSILANTDLNNPLMFYAYDDGSPFDVPGDIDYINIQYGAVVGGLHLSVIADPNSPHRYGAANLKSLDITTNGDGTNVLDAIDVRDDVGAIGPLWADAAGALTVGGDVLDEISIAYDMTELAVGGELLAHVIVEDINGPVSIGTMSQALITNDVAGPISIGTMTDEYNERKLGRG
jgi:hypothetical protein